MTCKNCIYEPMCHNVIAYGMDTDDVTGTLITDIEKHCKHFKDKSRVIVPPVKVGDTVYFDNTGYHDSAEIDGIHIDENGIAFSWVQYDVGVDITELWDEGEFDIEEIGKTVFLTLEEAEKALAEREGAPNAGNS